MKRARMVLAAAGAMAAVNTYADVPKNIILMISDGWGYNQVKAADYYSSGRDSTSVYESFPVRLPMATWSAGGNGYAPQTAQNDATYVKLKPTDSAASGTAIATGVKTYDAAINVDMDSIPLVNISQRAEALGKSAGVVTTVEWSHATPASMVAHNVSRNNYAALANEMIYDTRVDVIMGAGNPDFDDNGLPRTTKEYKYVGGDTTWNKLKAGTASNQEGVWSLIESKGAFDSLAAGLGTIPARVVGTAQVATTTQQARIGAAADDTVGEVPLNTNVPSLATMSKGALRVLSQNDKGFFLMIEGGAVDWAGHANQSARLIEEQMDFNDAVDSVVAWIEANGGWDENLLIVTGDHETGYLTGTGAVITSDSTSSRPAVQNNGAGKMPGMQWNSGDHTNQLIPLFAKGEGSEVLAGNADEWDPVRKHYLRNSEIGQTMFSLWSETSDSLQIPRYTFLMISDGCGYNSFLAANYYQAGKDSVQIYDGWPVRLPMSHYSAGGNGYAPQTAKSDATYVKLKPTDSAASGTAFSTGVKTYDAAINVDMDSTQLYTVTEAATDRGLATGVVTTVEYSHATPAAMAAHNISRNNYAAIANEMLYDSKLDVIMGAGNPDFDDDGQPRTTKEYKYVGGDTTWNKLKAGTASNQEGAWNLIESKSAFDSLAAGLGTTPDRVVGVAQVATTTQQARSGGTADDTVGEVTFNDNVPDLATMTMGAVRVLDQNDRGFFLMVEGGAIDWAGHANQSARLIEEQMDFNKAVDSVVAWIDRNNAWDEALVIVTADHETGYLTGSGAVITDDSTSSRPALQNNGAGKMPGMQWNSGDHTNQLVPVFAKGVHADRIAASATEWDPVRDYFTDNARIGQLIQTVYQKGIAPEPRTVSMDADGTARLQVATSALKVQGHTAMVLLSRPGHARLSLYSMDGERKQVLLNGYCNAGVNRVELPTTAGNALLVLESGSLRESRVISVNR